MYNVSVAPVSLQVYQNVLDRVGGGYTQANRGWFKLGGTHMKRIALGVLALVASPLASLAIPISGGDGCYIPTWFSNKITCEGGCGQQYTVCPGAILCTPVTSDGTKPLGTITTGATSPCRTYLAGTGTCPNCTGGTPITSTVISDPISIQDCGDKKC